MYAWSPEATWFDNYSAIYYATVKRIHSSVSIVWFVSLLLLRPVWIFTTRIPSLSRGRSLQSRSALKWSINSIRTPTPLWRFSAHVSASSAPYYSPKSSACSVPSTYLRLHTALEDIPHGKCAISIYSQTNERHKFCSQRVFSYKGT